MTFRNPKSKNLIDKDIVNEMIENAIRRHNRRSTIISAILGYILKYFELHEIDQMNSLQ